MSLIKISFKQDALKKAGTDFKTEVIAGFTTFLAMAYILAVNPSILSGEAANIPGFALMDKGAVFTATALSAAIATLVMGIFANLPFALAPGMGLNAFLTYTVCLTMGKSWQFVKLSSIRFLRTLRRPSESVSVSSSHSSVSRTQESSLTVQLSLVSTSLALQLSLPLSVLLSQLYWLPTM